MRKLLIPLAALLSVACSSEPESQAQPSIAASGAETRIEESPTVDVLPESQVRTGVEADLEQPRAAPSLPVDEPKPRALQSVLAGVARDTAVFAGGCFWCVEEAFDAAEGVVSTTSGYTGGRVANPTYEQVSAGGTGHAEVVRVIYNPSRVSYSQLLEVFWRNVDPLTPNQQFCDKGAQYRSAIFVRDTDAAPAGRGVQASVGAIRSLRAADRHRGKPGAPFYAAEEYHQDYYTKNPLRYKFYKTSCGRVRRLQELWGEA